MSKIAKLLKEEKDNHIRVLRYADMRGSFTAKEIAEDLKFTPEQVNFLQRELGDGGYFCHVSNNKDDGQYRYMLTLEGKSRLLEHDELTLARKNSREARWLAIAAILISIGIGAIQIFMTQNVRISSHITSQPAEPRPIRM